MWMSKRTANFVSALVATVLAGANLTAAAENAAGADSCLSSPKGTAPSGSHWFYRMDRDTKQKCWYLRELSGKAAKAAPAKQNDETATAAAEPPLKPARMHQSVANAHAEVRSPSPSPAQPPSTVAPQPASVAADNSQTAIPTTTGPQGSVLSSRWVDPPNASTPYKVATADAAAAAPQPEPEPAPEAAAPAAPQVASPPAERLSSSTGMLLAVMGGALTLAGLIGGALYRSGGTRKPPYEVDNEWRAPWAPTEPKRASLSRFADEEGQVRHVETPPLQGAEIEREEEPATRRPDPQIAEMLQRLARSTAN
jgi:hypothetical protein